MEYTLFPARASISGIMEAMDFSHTLQWIIAHGYTLMFLLMLVEGPAVTAAGAFAAALGYFNIYGILALSVFGNLVPDVLYYALGYWGRGRLIDRYRRFFRISDERIAKLERLFDTHPGKTLFAVKMIPGVATPGLIVAGATRMRLRTYIIWSIIITIPSSVLFLLIGYYFGAAYTTIAKYLDYGGYALGAALVIILLASYAYKKVAKRLGEKTGTVS